MFKDFSFLTPCALFPRSRQREMQQRAAVLLFAVTLLLRKRVKGRRPEISGLRPFLCFCCKSLCYAKLVFRSTNLIPRVKANIASIFKFPRVRERRIVKALISCHGNTNLTNRRRNASTIRANNNDMVPGNSNGRSTIVCPALCLLISHRVPFGEAVPPKAIQHIAAATCGQRGIAGFRNILRKIVAEGLAIVRQILGVVFNVKTINQ